MSRLHVAKKTAVLANLSLNAPTSIDYTRIRSTRITYVDLINITLSTMLSNRTSNDIDIVQPTQYNVRPNWVAKNLPPKPWPLLDITTALYF